MKKKGTLLSIMLLSCAIAGAYGIINDYFLYKFCPEFFTEFKFVEYGVANGAKPNATNKLINIIKVGLMASWWMGLIIGTILALLSLSIPERKAMYGTLFRGMGITIILTFVMSFVGLAYGWFTFSPNDREATWMFEDEKILQPRRFMMCFHMHNFSYIGAIMGMLAGSIFIIRRKQKLKAI